MWHSAPPPAPSPSPDPSPTPEPTPEPVASETGPKAISGYYPLYDLEASANAAGDGTSHSHEFDGVTYYMPNGVTFYHGDYGQWLIWWRLLIAVDISISATQIA